MISTSTSKLAICPPVFSPALNLKSRISPPSSSSSFNFGAHRLGKNVYRGEGVGRCIPTKMTGWKHG